MSGDIEHRDLVARLRAANDRMRGLQKDVDSADNVIRFRVERHVEAAEETLGDLNVRASDMPVSGSYERRLLERRLRGLEFEIVFAGAKLEAAWGEESEDLRGFVRATHRAMSAQRWVLSTEIAQDPPEHTPKSSARPEPVSDTL